MDIDFQPDFSLKTNEIQKISSEDTTALLPLLLKLDAHISSHNDEDLLIRKLRFLVYELKTNCEGLKEEDRINILNELFFDSQGYTSTQTQAPSFEDLSFSSLFSTKKADTIVLVILYQYFASKVNLPVYAVSIKPIHVLKWINKNHHCYIDIHRYGKIFNQNELLNILNKNKPSANCFEIITIKQTLLSYLKSLRSALNNETDDEKQMACLNLYLSFDESNLNALQERALLCYKAGWHNQALEDLKRYFSFTDYNCAPISIKTVYQKLIEIKKCESITVPTLNLLH